MKISTPKFLGILLLGSALLLLLLLLLPARWKTSLRKRPVTKIGFLKTHKTASSTVQNILMRYGRNSNWSFAMYATGSHLGPPGNQYNLSRAAWQPFNSSWLDRVPWAEMVKEQQGYNVFALHSVWDRREMEKVLGTTTAKFVTILRDPVAEFESLYSYSHFDKVFNMNLETFVHTYIGGRKPVQRKFSYLGRNQQLWDLGLGFKDLLDQQVVQQKILQLDKELDLVMLAEQFDASLVLLADTLSWPLRNMTSLKLNARKDSAIERITPKASVMLKDWLWADYMLYNHFQRELEHKKCSFGLRNLEENVRKLGEYNHEVRRDCVKEVISDSKQLSEDFIPWSDDVLGFSINEEKKFCKHFAISELPFIEELRTLQLEKLRLWQKQNSA